MPEVQHPKLHLATPDADRRYLYDMKRREAERARDEHNATHAKVDEAAVSWGMFTIRSAIVINGGAAVTVLAFIGGLAGQGRVAMASLMDMSNGLAWFSAGVAIAALASGTAYLALHLQSEALGSISKNWEPPFVRQKPAAILWQRMQNIAQLGAVFLALVSVVLFVFGMIDVKYSVTRLSSPANSFNPAGR